MNNNVFPDGNNDQCVNFSVGEMVTIKSYTAFNSSPYATILGYTRSGYYVVELPYDTILYGLSDNRLEKA